MNHEYRVDYDVVKRACDDIALEMNLPMDRFAVRTRDNYIKDIYNSCYQCVTPYNEMAYKWVNSTINGNLASWYANEYSIYKNAPMEWQKDAKETIVGMFKEAYPEREDLKEDYEEYGLPTSFSILLSDAEKAEMADSEDEEEFVSDYITNKYGFCHNGFTYEIVGDELIVSDVQWDIDEEDEFDFDDDELDENLTKDNISGDTLMQEVYDFIISESNEDRLVPFDVVRRMMNERGLRLEDYLNELFVREGQEGLLSMTIDGDQYVGPVSLLDKRSDEVAIVKKEEQKLERSVNKSQDRINGQIATERKWLEDATYGDIDELVDNVKYIYVQAPKARKYQPLIRKLFGQDADKVHITNSDDPNAKWSISADIYIKDVDKLPATIKSRVDSEGKINSIGLAIELYRAGAKLRGSKEVKESFGAHLLKETKDIKDKMYVGIWDDAQDDFVEYEEFNDFQDALEFASKYDYSKIKSGIVKFDTNSLFTKGFASEFDIVNGKTDLKAMQELMPKKNVDESLHLTEGHVEQKYKGFTLDWDDDMVDPEEGIADFSVRIYFNGEEITQDAYGKELSFNGFAEAKRWIDKNVKFVPYTPEENLHRLYKYLKNTYGTGRYKVVLDKDVLIVFSGEPENIICAALAYADGDYALTYGTEATLSSMEESGTYAKEVVDWVNRNNKNDGQPYTTDSLIDNPYELNQIINRATRIKNSPFNETFDSFDEVSDYFIGAAFDFTLSSDKDQLDKLRSKGKIVLNGKVLKESYDDWEESGIYGGDLTYCPICDTRLKYDEDGDHYCPKCKEDAHSLSMKRRHLMKESKVSPLDRAVEIYTTILDPYGNLNSPFDDEEDYIEDLKDSFKNKKYAEYFISEYEDDDDAKAQEFVSLLKNIHSIKEAVDPTKAKEVKKNSDAWAVLYGYKFRNEPEVELEPEEHDEKSLRARINEIVSSYNGKGNRPSKNAKETDFIFYVLYR